MDDTWFNVKDNKNITLLNKLISRPSDIYVDTKTNWAWTGEWIQASKLMDRMIDYKFSTKVITITKNDDFQTIINNNNIKEGDIIFFDGADGPGHTTIVSEVTKSEIYMSGHSVPYTHEPLSIKTKTYGKIYIVCLKDYLPK